MVTVSEKAMDLTSGQKLKRTVELICLIHAEISSLYSDVVMKLMEEVLLQEGPKEKIRIENFLKKIDSYIKELDNLNLVFSQEDLFSHINMQYQLNKVMVPIPTIQEIVFEMWAMRKLGSNEQDVEIIKGGFIKIIEVLTIKVNDIVKYVEAYNGDKTRKRNLIFNPKWKEFLAKFSRLKD